MTPLNRKSGFNNNKVLPPLSHKKSQNGQERESSPLVHGSILKSSTINRKHHTKLVISDKKITKFAGLKIIVGKENEKVDVKMDNNSSGSSLMRGRSFGSNLNPF
jgi:hypothetical protein